ncbi:MAG: hypothetical protein KDJ75_09435 [Alphaproteobacteria bacterium]|nr:hypothetical protein [Alphaproteobacteria bacterium]
MNNRLRRFILPAACAALLLSGAENARAENPPVPKDIAKYESAGLYKSRKDGGLGPELWRHARREAVQDYMELLPVSSGNMIFQNLTLSLLLSAADTTDMDDYKKPEAGEDLLTLRLEKLLSMGAYGKIYEIYNFLPDKPYHPRIARAGILSMLYSGEKSLACLENNTLQGLYDEDDFWTDLEAYCAYTLSDSPDEEAESALKDTKREMLRTLAFNKDYSFSYDTKAFEKLSALEQAFLTAESRIDISGTSNAALRKIPANHVGALLAQDDLSDKHKIALNILAVKYGLKTTEDLGKIYEITKTPEPEEAKTEWEKLPGLYKNAKHAKDRAESWAALKQTLPVTGTYGIESIMPFASMIAKNPPESASMNELRTVYAVLTEAGFDIPPVWADLLYRHRGEEAGNSKAFLILATVAHITNSHKYSNEYADLLETDRTKYPELVDKIKIITENIDKTLRDRNNTLEIYEKDFDLTSMKHYVMPSVRLWDRFMEAGENRIISEAVLLSILAFRDKQPGAFYPGTVREAIKNLNTVGLTDVSRSLAIEAILGSI